VFLLGCGAAAGDATLDPGLRADSAESAASFQPRQLSDFQAALGGTIPFPPEKLVNDLLALDPGSSVTSDILPHGRSLVRSATDFHDPRTVMVWQGAASSSPYFLYVGYAANAEELELIAWNRSRRQFDFAMVRDYAPGKTPQTVHPPRELCMACHQDGGPIFPVAPWNETSQNVAIKSQLDANAADSLSRYILQLSADPQVRVRRETSVMDFQVRRGSAMLQTQSICANACGGDLECRKGILLAAILENIATGTSSNIPDPRRGKMTAAMRSAWPSDGFAIIDDSIADRSVALDHPFDFDASEDPLSWRTLVSRHQPFEGTGTNLLAAYAQCWSFTPDQQAALRSWGASRVDAALDTEQIGALVAGWLPAEDAIMAALAAAISAPEPAHSPPSVPWAAPAPPGPVFGQGNSGDGTTDLFAEYCSYCHSGPTPRPPILPLSDLDALGRYVGSAGRTVRKLMDPAHPVMPPQGALQPTPAERQQMLTSLSAP
jgi:hypothetical protein